MARHSLRTGGEAKERPRRSAPPQAGHAFTHRAADEVVRAVDERIPFHRLEHEDALGDDRLDEEPPLRRAPNALSERSV